MGTLSLGTKSATEDESLEQTALTSGERITFYLTGDFDKPNESFGIYYKDDDGNFNYPITDITGREAVAKKGSRTLTITGPIPAYKIKKTATTNAMGINKSV